MKKLVLLVLLALLPVQAGALGYYTNVLQDEQGNTLAAKTVTIYLADTVTLASLYSDNGTTPIANPLYSDYLGRFEFWAANGLYDVCVSGTGITPFCLENQKILDEGHVGLPAFNVTDPRFGAIAGDDLDDTDAFQAAHDAAAAASPVGIVKIPPGDFDIYSTVTITDDVAIVGDGLKSQLISHITDGSAVLENVAAGQQRVQIEDISIVNYDPNVTGDWIGLNIDANRGFLKNVRVRGAATGFRISGFIWDMVNLWAYYCDVGFHADEFNAIRANINTEVCATAGVIIEDGGGIDLTGVCEDNEVGLIADGLTAARILLYFENNANGDILMGQTTRCKSVTVLATFGSSGGNSIFDQVDGLDLGGSRVSALTGIYLTENCMNVRGLPITTPSSYSEAQISWPRNIKSAVGLAAPQNYFTNPYFRGALRGYYNVVTARGAFTIDTANTINGGGLKVVADGSSSGSVVAQIELGPDIAASLAGDSVMVGGWIYIPDDDTHFPNTGSVYMPNIALSVYSGGAWQTGPTPPSQTWTNDGWTFFCRTFTVGGSATNVRVEALIQRTNGSTVPAGTTVTYSGVFVCPHPVNIQDLMMGRWTMHPLAGREVGNRLEWLGTSGATSDADQNYLAGDRIINSTAPADSILDWVCTVAGTGATDTWKYRVITLEP